MITHLGSNSPAAETVILFYSPRLQIHPYKRLREGITVDCTSYSGVRSDFLIDMSLTFSSSEKVNCNLFSLDRF